MASQTDTKKNTGLFDRLPDAAAETHFDLNGT